MIIVIMQLRWLVWSFSGYSCYRYISKHRLDRIWANQELLFNLSAISKRDVKSSITWVWCRGPIGLHGFNHGTLTLSEHLVSPFLPFSVEFHLDISFVWNLHLFLFFFEFRLRFHLHFGISPLLDLGIVGAYFGDFIVEVGIGLDWICLLCDAL